MTNRSTAVGQSVHQHDGNTEDGHSDSFFEHINSCSFCHLPSHILPLLAFLHATLLRSCNTPTELQYIVFLPTHIVLFFNIHAPRETHAMRTLCAFLLNSHCISSSSATSCQAFQNLLLDSSDQHLPDIGKTHQFQINAPGMTLQASNTTPKSFNSACLACFQFFSWLNCFHRGSYTSSFSNRFPACPLRSRSHRRTMFGLQLTCNLADGIQPTAEQPKNITRTIPCFNTFCIMKAIFNIECFSILASTCSFFHVPSLPLVPMFDIKLPCTPHFAGCRILFLLPTPPIFRLKMPLQKRMLLLPSVPPSASDNLRCNSSSPSRNVA